MTGNKRWIAVTAPLAACVLMTFAVLAVILSRPAVTKANFDRIEIGMSYEEVVKIFGTPGVEWTGHGTFTFDKKWTSDDGSYAGIAFLHNAVCEKTWMDSTR